jgi:hypothetical protein
MTHSSLWGGSDPSFNNTRFDLSPYMKSDEFEVTIGNLREYQE